MIKDFLMRKMLERQLKNVPKEEQERLITLITKNPEFFQKIAEEIKKRMDGGMEQTAATMAVMQMYQKELQEIAGKPEQKA